MHGVLNVLKPPGMTSSNVVSALRRILGVKRIGHTGTLDPGAAGVLPMCVGSATRLFDYLVNKEKEYIAELTLGACSDTQDSYGTLLRKYPLTDVSAEEFAQTLASFQGQIQQKTPLYSAVSVGGNRLYRLARQGVEVDTPIRSVEVREIHLLRKTGPGRFLFSLQCSKGTYVRAICEDIGLALGSGAYTSFLLRTRAGCFALEEALTLEEIEERHQEGRLALLPIDQALMDLPAISVAPACAKMLRNGNAVAIERAETPPREGALYRLYCGGEFYAVCRAENGFLAIQTLFYQPK